MTNTQGSAFHNPQRFTCCMTHAWLLHLTLKQGQIVFIMSLTSEPIAYREKLLKNKQLGTSR